MRKTVKTWTPNIYWAQLNKELLEQSTINEFHSQFIKRGMGHLGTDIGNTFIIEWSSNLN